MAHTLRRLLTGSVCAAALPLAGCGGGGGGARPQPAPPPVTVAPTPTPTPAPTPTPSPTPTPTGLADAEYRRSGSALLANAITAHEAGATGAGVKIAIIDSGIDTTNPEFAGRIDPASRDVVGNRNSLTDDIGHGSSVTSVAAAARNGALVQGVAYGATILSFRTDEIGPCGDECNHNDRDIAVGVDLARENGARVINISLGGGPPAAQLVTALDRATRAGIVVVISAGNDGREAEGSNPDPFALDSARAAGNGLLVIAGSHDDDRALSEFSNRAGAGAQYYIAALGRGVAAVDNQQRLVTVNGTSFAAPAVAGAAALLAQAFPTLTGAQIVSLLLGSADDAGEPGIDTRYGHGTLNIARAFAPRGATSLAGSAAPVSLSDNGQTSPAMGDAGGNKGPAMAGIVILDGYSRAYAVNLAGTLSRAPQDRPLAGALQGDVHSATALAGATSVSITMRRNLTGTPEVGLALTGLSYQDSRKARAIAGLAISRLTPRTAVALGFSESGKTLQHRLAGAGNGAFLVARDPMVRTGFVAEGASTIGIRHDLGPVAVTITGERGRVTNPGFGPSLARSGFTSSSITADRRIGRATLSLGGTRLAEEGTVLGGRFGPTFGNAGATSTFIDGAAGFDLGRGWGVAASYRRGWTALPGAGGLVRGGRLTSDAFAFDVTKRDTLMVGDRFALRVMQPLRVRSGGFDLQVPTSYDYFTKQVGYEARQYGLAPSGRELDIEAAYGMGVLGGDLSANLFLRTDPGHIAAMNDDIGGAIRFTLGF